MWNVIFHPCPEFHCIQVIISHYFSGFNYLSINKRDWMWSLSHWSHIFILTPSIVDQLISIIHKQYYWKVINRLAMTCPLGTYTQLILPTLIHAMIYVIFNNLYKWGWDTTKKTNMTQYHVSMWQESIAHMVSLNSVIWYSKVLHKECQWHMKQVDHNLKSQKITLSFSSFCPRYHP